MSETIMGISGLPGWHINDAGAGLIIGSMQTSSIVNPLPQGTNMLGSVVAEIVGLSTSDYVSVVGSPNYSLPILNAGGSVFLNPGTNYIGQLGAGSLMVGSTNIREERFGTVTDGSIWITSNATTILQPKERQTFVVVPGSVSSNNLNSKIWLGVDSNIVPGKGLEITTNQIFGLSNYIGSVTGIIDAGSILVGYWEM